MFIPGEYSRLDVFDGLVDDHPEQAFPPVLACDVPLWQADAAQIVRSRVRQLQREERAERRAEVRMTVLVALFVIVAGTICTVVDWALAVAVVHP